MTRQGQQPFNNLGASLPTSVLGGSEIEGAPSYIKGAGENKMKTIMSKLDYFIAKSEHFQGEVLARLDGIEQMRQEDKNDRSKRCDNHGERFGRNRDSASGRAHMKYLIAFLLLPAFAHGGGIIDASGGNQVPSFTVNNGSTITTLDVLSTATVGGLLNLASPSGGTGFSANSPGYTYLPNGLILQWGSYLGTMSHGSYYNPTFPIAFPHACLGVNFTVQSNQSTTSLISYAELVPGDISTTGFEFQWGFSTGGSASNCGIWWTAVGY